MEKISRDKIKVRGLNRIKLSFKYSIDGLKYAYKYEQSMLLHLIATISAVVFGIFFRIEPFEWLVTFLTIGMLLAAELINTAIEAAVDLTTLEINPLAKIAKDCGSAATFVLSIMGFVLALIVYVPYFIDLLGL